MDTPSFDDSDVPRRSDTALQAEVGGDLVLLSSADLGFYGTDGVGEDIWKLVDGERTVGQIIAELETSFTAPPGAIRAESLAFLEELRTAGLLRG